ncbi:S9 family peptidase [Paramuribaculum intestinale]|uniref:S9 family peptidase n=1 Tax=Paramuribaculum intestinale TaxID=2094151 RepID=UPI002729ABF9|nr:prolyl oligopeptidase family serine peptidase [Paramuribaculum intestinale]
MEKPIFIAAALAVAVGSSAVAAAAAAPDTIAVETPVYYVPTAVAMPVMVDSTDVSAKSFDAGSLLRSMPRLDAMAPVVDAPARDASKAEVGALSFRLENRSFGKVRLTVEGADRYLLNVDGRKVAAGEELQLSPATHRVELAWLRVPGDTAGVPKVGYVTATPERFSVRNDGKRMYTLEDVLSGRRVRSVSVAPSGQYLLSRYEEARPDGTVEHYSLLSGPKGFVRGRRERADVAWMPVTDRYYYTAEGTTGRELRAVDAASGEESILATGLPQGYFTIAPDERTLIFYVAEEGHKENPDVYRISEPEDRQPGWRTRHQLAAYDLATGIMRPLTFGHTAAQLLDISGDSRELLVRLSRSRLEKRPTTVSTIAILNLDDMSLDTIVADDGFIGTAIFSPDASQVAITGSPEALGGIGNCVPQGRVPSMVDNQLYVYSRGDRSFRAMTRDFDPSVESVEWSRADGKVYFTAENRDMKSLYRMDPKSGRIAMIALPEDMIGSFSVPAKGAMAAFTGHGAQNPDRLYRLDLRKDVASLLDEPMAERLADVELGEFHPWSFVNSRGDSIHGRYYLPPSFDPSRKYPMIVNYYGGCSPTGRDFESRYPHNAYTQLGYVVYVLNPSGAAGFGQEFSSRHVNTAGQGVADDIIEGTKKFCGEHPWVDSSKIGCIGASYGGFMTQYLQTVTDIFAAAISHAGISDHTSYWGEGYWGYSYSEVSMGGSYPWTRKDLYVDQSPLFRADKIHTPLLFLHGDKDVNVPVGESIQMFTALKLLGRPTAFVAVKDQDHHILDYDKRRRWQDTIFAWFARWLQDDPEWWDTLYPAVPGE